MAQQPDEKTIVHYLLGALNDAETERLDELSVSDDRFAERLRATENDLVDCYARGELDRETLERFKQYYLASSRRREKAGFAGTFLALSNRDTTDSAEEQPGGYRASATMPSRLRGLRESFSGPKFALAFAAAAFLLLAVGGFLAYQNLRLRNQTMAERTERDKLAERQRALERQLAEQQSISAGAEKELQEVRQRLNQLEFEAANQSGGKTPGGISANIAAVTLPPPTRATGQPPAVTLTAKIEQVALTLELEANDFKTYQVSLKDPASDRIIWRSGRLAARKKGDNNVVVVRLPGGFLKLQHYSLDLMGVPADAAPEIVGSYPFTVVRK